MKKTQTKATAARRAAAKKTRHCPPPAKWPEKWVTVTLTRSHIINSQPYGPGSVKVKSGVAAVLMEQERNAQQVEERFRDPEPMGTIIGARGRLVKVPGSQFDQYLEHGPVVGTF